MLGVTPDSLDIGDMSKVCPFCGARSWHSERAINCCASGEIQLPAFPEPPPALSAAILAPQVRKHIRAYNMSLCMASVGHKKAGLPDGMFVLGGKAFHRIGSMLPDDGDRHAFAQIYTLDVDEATDRRIGVCGGNNSDLRRDLLAGLHELLMAHNPWIQQFVAAARGDVPRLVWRCSDDISTMQVGAIVSEPGSRRDIVVHRANNGPLMRIHDGHPLYHPLSYPLLFPLGTTGWTEDMQVISTDYLRQRRLTLTEWGRYYLMHRDAPTHVQKCEKLALEFYCDLWAQMESRMAHFHRQPAQQAKYRAARVAAVEDQLSNGIGAAEIGQPVIRLPSSFVGSAKYYQQLYLDAMALPKRFGKPDLFITMTCNPGWPEIRNALPPGAKWHHHPDIVSRVFMIKMQELIDDIVRNEIFGTVHAYVFRIEWQARGLPHAHMLFILKDKILSARHIDAVVSAELPDPVTEPVLSALVLKHMLHPRCDVNTSYGCRHDANGKECDCVRHFPKIVSTETVIVPDGYPKYMRRCRNTATLPDGRIISDTWVVAYNRYLLLKYQCHLNVEICAHFRCFKYVYKYAFKAPDYTAVAVDEIDAHLSGRLLSVSEAVHRLLSLPLHKEWPSVLRLDIHLPHEQRMVFDPTADEETLLEQLRTTTSTLMGWFALNACDPFARSLLYHEIPEHYVWVESCWRRRENIRMSVGRIYGVSQHNSELFALRRLLHVVKGAVSFQDIATFDGTLHDSFRSACLARGLFAEDGELVSALMEIVEVEVSVMQIRRHFARMLVHSAPMDAQALFNQFVDDLCEGPADAEGAVGDALLSIESIMNEMGRSLTDADYGFELPATREAVPSAPKRRRLCNIAAVAMSPEEASRERDRLLAIFTDEQRDALQQVVESVGSNAHCNVFALLASAGSGKTEFANGLAAYIRAQGRSVVCVAASALAAMLLPAGCTAHSAFHIPIPANELSHCNLSRAERAALKKADVIIYDECSMVHEHVADTVDRSVQDAMSDSRPFGGKTVLFMGDFKQLLPVVRYGSGHNHTVQRCRWWQHVRKLTFSKNWRAVLHPEYCSFLEDVGNGRMDSVVVPQERIVTNYSEMIEAVYGAEFNCKHQILALTLDTCAIVNKMCIEKLPGDAVECPSADSYVECSDPDSFPSEYVESMQMHGAPPFLLHLKIGARYMCIKNLDMQRGVINGTMMQLIAMGRRYLQFRILTGKSAGSCEIMMKTLFSITPEASGLPFTVLRRQYPIIPAYCLSVHKAQGQSLLKVGLIFESDPFTHGQLYVALSRVACWLCIVVMMHEGESAIKNLVHKHLL